MTENYIVRREEKGTVNISEEVIISIVKNALKEVEGFSGLTTTAGAEIAGMVGLRTVPKGIKARFENERIVIDCIVTVDYGFNIIETAEKLQQSVFTAVCSATGIDKAEVNIHVAGISF